uniref:Uncharacterized protein n=1 Tax=Setaria viridis TaxID=4556 RepID=A0A4U6V557_SETVI|nr:hypothetical protein SEVIR_4G296500v2 [Setaria viridis]
MSFAARWVRWPAESQNSIWSVRNDWTFNNVPPSVHSCKRKFMEEMNIVCLHRARSSLAPAMMEWLSSL